MTKLSREVHTDHKKTFFCHASGDVEVRFERILIHEVFSISNEGGAREPTSIPNRFRSRPVIGSGWYGERQGAYAL